MSIADTAGRLAATLLSMVQTRLALASLEMEEQSRRYLGFLLMSLLALFLFGIAIVLAAGTPTASRRCSAWPPRVRLAPSRWA